MVMAVSLVSSGRRALVSAVSCGQCECVVMALNVLISLSCRAGREKVRPARSKHLKFGVFVLAGRVFSRKCRCEGRAERTFSRQPTLHPVL